MRSDERRRRGRGRLRTDADDGADDADAAPAPSTGGASGAATASSDDRSDMLSLFKGVAPLQTLREGDVIGEAELMQDEPISATTVITTSPIEIIELTRETFEAKLKEDFASDRGRILRFLQQLMNSQLEPILVLPKSDVQHQTPSHQYLKLRRGELISVDVTVAGHCAIINSTGIRSAVGTLSVVDAAASIGPALGLTT